MELRSNKLDFVVSSSVDHKLSKNSQYMSVFRPVTIIRLYSQTEISVHLGKKHVFRFPNFCGKHRKYMPSKCNINTRNKKAGEFENKFADYGQANFILIE